MRNSRRIDWFFYSYKGVDMKSFFFLRLSTSVIVNAWNGET
jgi:hypothetical protein